MGMDKRCPLVQWAGYFQMDMPWSLRLCRSKGRLSLGEQSGSITVTTTADADDPHGAASRPLSLCRLVGTAAPEGKLEPLGQTTSLELPHTWQDGCQPSLCKDSHTVASFKAMAQTGYESLCLYIGFVCRIMWRHNAHSQKAQIAAIAVQPQKLSRELICEKLRTQRTGQGCGRHVRRRRRLHVRTQIRHAGRGHGLRHGQGTPLAQGKLMTELLPTLF